ncbi:T9SS type A sorting domain-containing protein, partial [Algibacter sp.]|uniref:T9SS type A sorting domain-containing protein n=1 Tax=Algibacter sp. TaxID=1872428 RepID=UPI003C758897
TDTSPYTQDFCITPNGTHNDLDITILPIAAARPGFDTDYKLVFKNKGTTTLSGTVDLTFQDDVMDFVSADPTVDAQVLNNLSWIYSNLMPFESREILFTMNLNTPMETPAVNGDDVLVFNATVNPTTGDETPQDNVFTLNQTVVNSYDPNDKTCLEGNTITPDLIGGDVHYMIRFENTGTANAINVVVKDVIDTDKFDVSTLYLTDSSHDLVTNISNTNVVEFIFEDINLPFDDANNDGYVAFKIKTLATLVEGDIFENGAEIYFDYNFPIITNNAQTAIQSPLSKKDFDNTIIAIYPNPAQNKLFIEGENGIKSVTIYDISGRLIHQISYLGHSNSREVSTENLVQGTYLVKIKTASGESIRKIVKE